MGRTLRTLAVVIFAGLIIASIARQARGEPTLTKDQGKMDDPKISLQQMEGQKVLAAGTKESMDSAALVMDGTYVFNPEPLSPVPSAISEHPIIFVEVNGQMVPQLPAVMVDPLNPLNPLTNGTFHPPSNPPPGVVLTPGVIQQTMLTPAGIQQAIAIQQSINATIATAAINSTGSPVLVSTNSLPNGTIIHYPTGQTAIVMDGQPLTPQNPSHPPLSTILPNGTYVYLPGGNLNGPHAPSVVQNGVITEPKPGSPGTWPKAGITREAN